MNIAAYCRVSTDKEDQLNSLDAQKKFFAEYADKYNYNLTKIYADEGISGTKIKNRKEFQKLLRDAEYGIFDMVVVKDISRFARNTVDLLNSTRKLKEYGIETTFLTANMTVLGQSEFVLTIFGALAQEESANTSKRVKFGKKINAEKGKVPNLVYGYDKIKDDYFNLKINENEALVIKRIFSLYLNSGYGTNKIAEILNNEGIKTKRNCSFTQNSISRILTNPIYTGKIINCKEQISDFLTSKREKNDKDNWIITDKPEIRIIDDETFKMAEKILEERKNSFFNKHERQSNKHLFSTLIKCKNCGSSFRRCERKYKNTYVTWVCSQRNSKGKDSCPNAVTIGEEDLKDSLKKYFCSLIKNEDEAIKCIVKEFNKIYKSQNENSNSEKDIKSKIDKTNKQREKIINVYEDELISRDEMRKRLSSINMDMEKLQNELKLVQYNLTKSEQLERILSKTFGDFHKLVDIENATNAQLKKIIDKITVDENKKVDIYLKLLSDIGLEQSVLVSYNRT